MCCETNTGVLARLHAQFWHGIRRLDISVKPSRQLQLATSVYPAARIEGGRRPAAVSFNPPVAPRKIVVSLAR
jgi:hypothetical protein